VAAQYAFVARSTGFQLILVKKYEIFKLLSLYSKRNYSVFRLQSHQTENNQYNCLTLPMAAVLWAASTTATISNPFARGQPKN